MKKEKKIALPKTHPVPRTHSKVIAFEKPFLSVNNNTHF